MGSQSQTRLNDFHCTLWHLLYALRWAPLFNPILFLQLPHETALGFPFFKWETWGVTRSVSASWCGCERGGVPGSPLPSSEGTKGLGGWDFLSPLSWALAPPSSPRLWLEWQVRCFPHLLRAASQFWGLIREAICGERPHSLGGGGIR